MWVTKYLGIIESDLSAVHRIDDMYSLSSRRFIGLVTRLPYYKAAGLRQMIEMEQEENESGNNARNYEAPVPVQTTPPPESNSSTSPKESKIHQLGPLAKPKKKPDRVYDDVSKNLELFELGFMEAGVG